MMQPHALKSVWIHSLACLTLLSAAAIAADPETDASPDGGAERPNFVVIMLDDMGFSDLGCYGGEIDTPHIDRLARNGLRFTRFYNGSRCSPTRASLLTGVYPHQANMGRNNAKLSPNAVTLAEVLGENGYETAMAGKWHLSRFGPRGHFESTTSPRYMKWLNNQIDGDVPYSPRDTWPMKRGFDRFYGVIWGVVNFFNPFSLAEGMNPIRDIPEDYYITHAITRYSVKYIEQMAKKDGPFFLYTAHTAPHWPLHAPEDTIAKYEGVYDDGWHALRRERYQRQLEMGLVDEQTHPLPELMGGGEDWDELSEQEKAFQARKMAVHAAMIDEVDKGVGRMIGALKRAGEFENTLILILSDNGASPERPSRPGYDRASETEDGRKIHYDDNGPLEELGSATSWAGIGSYWANAANTPYRYWKKESFEGGNHTPFIAHWPAGIDRQEGATTDQLGHVIDVMPTCLELAGAEHPDTYEGRSVEPVAGRSLVPVFHGHERDGHEALFFEHVGGKAVIRDGWKAVQPTDGERWRLYNVKEERTEITNLAEDHPDRLETLVERWQAWRRRVRFSDRKTFELEKGADLDQSRAPFVTASPFTITAEFEGGASEGVILAHGGNRVGYALYVKDGRLHFGIRDGGELSEFAVNEPLPTGRVRVAVELTENRRVRIALDGKRVLDRKIPSLLSSMPLDGLQVGRDLRSDAGSYDGDAAYPKPIHSVRIELR